MGPAPEEPSAPARHLVGGGEPGGRQVKRARSPVASVPVPKPDTGGFDSVVGYGALGEH